MSDTGTLLFSATVGVLCGFAVTMGVAVNIYRQQMIELDVGYYDARSGEFATRKCAAAVQVRP